MRLRARVTGWKRRSAGALTGALALLAALLLAACGSATATDHRSPGVAAVATGATSAIAPSPAGDAGTECAQAVAATLRGVAARIYREAATGGDVAQAVHRVRNSAALASAIDSGNASAARAALQALLLNQIVRVEVLRGGRPFASAGAGQAIAPVRGSIPGTSASFVLSVQADRGFLLLTRRLSGSEVLLLAGGHRVAGTLGGPSGAGLPSGGPTTFGGRGYQVVTLGGAEYPSGGLRIVLLVPAASISCPGTTAQARVETLGHVGEHIYEEESHSAEVAATLGRLEGSSAFVRAVAAGDAAATRTAIIGFFQQHIHVVRVRVTIGSRLLVDVGGPFVLAPVHGTLRQGGRVIGHFAMAIQDDAGYLKLAQLFTGADVLMRTGGRQIMGTLDPGPATVPDRGAISYRGRTYEAYSFTGEAFPAGPLRLSLLIES